MSAPDLDFVHRFEPATEPAGPTLLLLHGTGGSEHDLIDLGRTLFPGAALLSPRGQVSENGHLRFFRRLAEGVFDLADLRLRTTGLASFVGEAAAAYGFDPEKVVAVGFSNGANIAGSLLLSESDALAGAVLLAPMVPFVPESPPDLTEVPVFVGAGRADPLVPPQGTEHLVELLKAGGASVETFWHPGGHQLTRTEIEAAQTWLQRKNHPWN